MRGRADDTCCAPPPGLDIGCLAARVPGGRPPIRLAGTPPRAEVARSRGESGERDERTREGRAWQARRGLAGSRTLVGATRLASDWRLVALELVMVVLRAGPVLMLLCLMVVLALLEPVFLTTRNIGNVLAQTSVISVLAMGQLLVIVTRGVDLSVGATVALSSVVGALAFGYVDGGLAIVVVMLATGLTVGVVNGVVYVWGRMPHPFIVTLASLERRPRAGALAGRRTLHDAGRDAGPHPLPGQRARSASCPSAPSSSVLLAVVARGLHQGHGLGTMDLRRWAATPKAARRAAIPVPWVTFSVYAMCGLLAGVAAVLASGRANGGSPNFGQLAELDSIAAVVIGGVSFLGGRGNVGNALVGAVMIGVIRNGMNLLNVDAFVQLIVIGVVIAAAVELDVMRSALESRLRVLRAERA